MNLLEFTRIVNKIFHSTKNPKDYEVVIPTSEEIISIKSLGKSVNGDKKYIKIEPKEGLKKD